MAQSSLYQKYICEQHTIERIRLIGHWDESLQVMRELRADGWWLTETGPYVDSRTPKVWDMDRFSFRAEREVA